MKVKFSLSIILASILGFFSASSESILSFPFGILGQALGRLSLWSPLGNGLAMALYVLVCLLPLFYCFSRESIGEEGVYSLAFSGALFYCMYRLLNPLGLEATTEVFSIQMGSLIWALLLFYLALIMLKRVEEGDWASRYFSYSLYVLGAVSSFFMGALGNDLFAGIEGKFWGEIINTISQLVILGFSLRTIYLGLILHLSLSKDFFAKDGYSKARSLAQWSKLSLLSILGIQVLTIGGQILLSRQNLSSEANLRFPLYSLLLIIFSYLLGQKIQEVRRVKEENDLFI